MRPYHHFLPCLGLLAAIAYASPAFASSVIINGPTTVIAGSTNYYSSTLDGVSAHVEYTVNGIAGGNSTIGTMNSNTAAFVAPLTVPAGGITVAVGGAMDRAPFAPVELLNISVVPAPIVPTITSITPTNPACTSTTFTINGNNFSANSTVRFAGVNAAATFVSTTQLQFVGNVTVNGTLSTKVSNPDGSSASSSAVKSTLCPVVPPPPPPPPPAPSPVTLVPADAETLAAIRLLDQATFGPTTADIALAKEIGPAAWVSQQIAMSTVRFPLPTDLNQVRANWVNMMMTAPNQLRQRMIHTWSELFVVTASKNPYPEEMQPWLDALNEEALGNFRTLLFKMTMNPAMGKFLDLGNSVMPVPNENYGREVMQLFTIGTVMLNMDGSVKLGSDGKPIPTYNQATIVGMSHALSGLTFCGERDLNDGSTPSSFDCDMVPRDNHHDMNAKTIVGGQVLPAGRSTMQDVNAVIDALFFHPNTAPFIATRLIRSLVSSNPSPAYINRVATVFVDNGSGVRGDLAAVVTAVLLDPEARSAPAFNQGHLKEPILHLTSMLRALNGSAGDLTNLGYSMSFLGCEPLYSASVFNCFSPLSKLPGNPQFFGPEFQIYAPSLALQRWDFIFDIINFRSAGMLDYSIDDYVAAAPNAQNLINLVNARLLNGRMSQELADAINVALFANPDDNRERAITAISLAAISSEFMIIK